MSFTKITSDVIIVPFITDFIKKNESIKTRLALLFRDYADPNNPSDNKLNNSGKLNAPSTTSIIGYFNGTELVMFRDKKYYNAINLFINEMLLKDTPINDNYVIYKGIASHSTINDDISQMIHPDILFEITNVETYEYKSYYISYVNRFDIN